MSFDPYGIVSQKRSLSYANGWSAEIVWCLPESEVVAHIAAHGLDTYSGASIALDPLQVVQITDEPWMDGDVVQVTGASASRKVTYTFAVVYLDVLWPDNITKPNYAADTTLKLSTKYAGQYMTLPPAAIQPVAGGPGPGPNTQATQFIALNEYTVEWDRVIDTGDLDFSNLIGCINIDQFMGCEPGTLLCEGVSLEPSFVINPISPLAWKASVTLKQRRIVVGRGPNAGIYGWNDWYNAKTQQWEPLTLSNGEPPYFTAAFAGLFS